MTTALCITVLTPALTLTLLWLVITALEMRAHHDENGDDCDP